MSAEATAPIAHPRETESNEVRSRAVRVEPKSLRTFTPSLAVIAKSAGAYHWTPEGRKLADFTSGVLVANLGHNPTRWWRRVWQYLGLGEQGAASGEFFPAVPLTAYNAMTEVEIAATERLLANVRRAPGGGRCEQVMWAASGSEAIQKALWASMFYQPGRDLVVATRYGFHGKKGLAGAVTGSEKDKERDPRVVFISFPMEECKNVARRREPLDLAPYRAELEALWKQYGTRLAALITEPYLGGGGSFHPQPEYLQLLQSFCREHDLTFILDEVQANFGRTGKMYAFTHYGLEPDIVVLGKGLGNGVPVSAAVGRADIMGRMTYGEGSDTWSANPLASAAVLATLDEFEQNDVVAKAEPLAAVVQEGLLRLAELPVVANIRGEGHVWGVEFADHSGKTANHWANAAVEACYLGDEQGRAIHLLGPLAGKVLRVSPPLTMDVGEARDYLAAMYEIIKRLG